LGLIVAPKNHLFSTFQLTTMSLLFSTSKAQNKVKVTSFGFVIGENDKNWFQVNYLQSNKEGESYEAKLMDWMQVPSLRKSNFPNDTEEQNIQNTLFQADRIVSHVLCQYKKFFVCAFSEEDIQDKFLNCVRTGMPYLNGTQSEIIPKFTKFLAQEDYYAKWNEDFRNAIICFIWKLTDQENEEMTPIGSKPTLKTLDIPVEMFIHTSYDGKKYFNPTPANKLLIVGRAEPTEERNEKGKVVYKKVPKSFKGQHYVDIKPNAYNGQYPLQMVEHDMDVVGLLYKTITESNAANDKELCFGKCNKWTYKDLTRLQIFSKPSIEVVVEEPTEQDLPDGVVKPTAVEEW
jgi:hypothetical protein